MTKLLFSGCAVLGLMVFSAGAYAAEASDYFSKERFQLRVRALGVVPQESSSVNIGGDINVENSITPEIDLTYYFTPNISVEAIAGTSKHSLSHSSGASLGQTWVLPPTVTLQYHFTPDQKFSPYVGAGVNYSIFYHEDTAGGFSDLNIDNGFGPAAQAGFDYWINDHWGFNFDVKKIWLNVDASLNNGAIEADVDLDPWLIGAGVSYRF